MHRSDFEIDRAASAVREKVPIGHRQRVGPLDRGTSSAISAHPIVTRNFSWGLHLAVKSKLTDVGLGSQWIETHAYTNQNLPFEQTNIITVPFPRLTSYPRQDPDGPKVFGQPRCMKKNVGWSESRALSDL